jgi:hypothetical protein
MLDPFSDVAPTALPPLPSRLELPRGACGRTCHPRPRVDPLGLIRAFESQDGTSRGMSGVYVLVSPGIVCQRTPDAGLVRFLFRHTAGSWKFASPATGRPAAPARSASSSEPATERVATRATTPRSASQPRWRAATRT